MRRRERGIEARIIALRRGARGRGSLAWTVEAGDLGERKGQKEAQGRPE